MCDDNIVWLCKKLCRMFVFLFKYCFKIFIRGLFFVLNNKGFLLLVYCVFVVVVIFFYNEVYIVICIGKIEF